MKISPIINHCTNYLHLRILHCNSNRIVVLKVAVASALKHRHQIDRFLAVDSLDTIPLVCLIIVCSTWIPTKKDLLLLVVVVVVRYHFGVLADSQHVQARRHTTAAVLPCSNHYVVAVLVVHYCRPRQTSRNRCYHYRRQFY